MEAVHRSAAPREFIAFHRRAVRLIGEGVRAESPRAEKIILGAGTIDGRLSFAIDEKHVVAFAPPAVLILQDGHRDAGEMPTALRFEPHVVAGTVEILAII